MKEHPIIFNSRAVRAILNGRKTQMRRVIDRISGFGKITQFDNVHTSEYDWTFRNKRMLWNDIKTERLLEGCSCGKPGDRLWVQEDWSVSDGTLAQYFIYKVDGRSHPDIVDFAGHRSKGKWRSSIYMPRRTSRITLEITDIRVERVQDISASDCIKEGYPTKDELFVEYGKYRFAKRWFIDSWDSFYAKRGYGWQSNPWVWVVSFEKLELKQ